jgi:hypothetical protein
MVDNVSTAAISWFVEGSSRLHKTALGIDRLPRSLPFSSPPTLQFYSNDVDSAGAGSRGGGMPPLLSESLFPRLHSHHV